MSNIRFVLIWENINEDKVVAILVFEMHLLLAVLVVTVLVSGGSTKFVLRTVHEYSGDEGFEQWLTHQKLDHFDPTNLSTWKQRYFVKDGRFTNHSGPVFLYIEGEQSLNPVFMDGGSILDLAAHYGAFCFGLEHRFYGDSHPTPDLTVENLRYLSSEQALADIAYFINNMNTKYGFTSKNKWVVFGGSYAGALAAWARMKYPHLIHAALSASGPVLAKASVEFGELFGHVAAQHSQQCADNVHQAALELANLLNQTGGSDILTETFNLCQPLDMKNVDDVSVFTDEVIYGMLENLQEHGSSALQDICDTMTEGQGDILESYAIATGFRQENCSDIQTFNQYIEPLKNISYCGTGRQWFYQTCTEFGFYTTASSRNGFFGDDLHLPFYIDQCTAIFGERFNKELLNEGIQRTNLMYGDLDIEVSRVIFTQGSLDPWSILGVKNSKPDAPAIVINGTTHCDSLDPLMPDDPQALKDAIKEIYALIEKWLSV